MCSITFGILGENGEGLEKFSFIVDEFFGMSTR
jgi:hypothetical protein